MNPVLWNTETKLAWFVVCLIGAILGTMYAWLQTPFHGAVKASEFFLLWLPNIHLYWPWSFIGALLAGMSFYVLRLLTTAVK